MSNPFSRRLYLRIWLAVVGGMAVLTLAVGWAWRIASEQNALSQPAPPPREVVLLDASGQTILRGLAIRVPPPAGAPPGKLEFSVEGEDGQLPHTLQFSPRVHPPGGERDRRGGPEAAFWTRPPFGFLWMLGIVGIAVAVGVFPIIRRLLKRLENLQRGVQRFGEGDLSARVPEHGQDEVADLARQFNAAAARVETLVKSHKSLLANASHELRSPLTRIRMGLELMQGSTPSPAFRSEILRNIAELDQLVDEILLASRLDAREADMGTVETVDLMGLAAEECVRVDAELQAADGTAADALEVRGIAKLLRRALRNLLENARRYSQGDITVTLRSTATQVEVSVCDQGPGVPPAQRERIFEPFYRLPGASERSGGVGLGLSLVRSIAERHDGSVYCTDRPDGAEGACFVLRLPRAG
ncbi:HAMP domain-containing sensor histidine kinase [Paracidovorax avenae]|uniref:HAMP domain-containing sensor histidine kinase n=1 Tax=Paracidovorax avenae TaxID=80867 RepID=UPI0006B38D94|nr:MULTISPECIES: HAMP domain-containing sensor histidine kinase [Comamonadaceae]AVS65059.1 sensor histidine kinase [Paracidovorax avenae]AVS69177.1 sensor histidine kinase [Paracidovorax avenae]MDA8449909.1 HAMP domain-containing histidine kinase [Acidovorax sp. GBBC 3297]MDA8459354.1 HAMP domain-containing histidine kinase [Acidovorax sp. GBBC 3333]MDA8464391.1 HAMP domain-containing histidine kinase [Acidovorax sp. GBBC 3332]